MWENDGVTPGGRSIAITMNGFDAPRLRALLNLTLPSAGGMNCAEVLLDTELHAMTANIAEEFRRRREKEVPR